MLKRLGLTSLSRLKQASQDTKKWESRSQKLSEELERNRKEMKDWRGKAEEAAKKLKHSAQEAQRQTERLQKLTLEAEKKDTEVKKKAAALEELKLRLGTAERELTVARENLMAVEVKLDILEGAANVLDARTRDAMARRAAESGAPV